MSESLSETLLAGRVQHLRLPVFHQPTGPEAPVLKRLLLPQGELAQIHDSDEGLHYLALIELVSGGVRDNHYHLRKKEILYVLSGEVELLVEDRDSDQRLSLKLPAGDVAVIQPGIAHALRTIHPGFALEFSPTRYDPADTHRHVITSAERP